MSRRNRAQRKIVQADPCYDSRLVTLLISRILASGKKSLAQRIVYNALEIINNQSDENPIYILGEMYKLYKGCRSMHFCIYYELHNHFIRK